MPHGVESQTPGDLERRYTLTDFFSSSLFYFGFAIWFGAFVFFGMGVAPVLFTELSREAAGQVNSTILIRLNILEFAGAFCMLSGLALFVFRYRGLRNLMPLFLLVIALGITSYYALSIGPEMRELREAILHTDAVETVAGLQTRFDDLHALYTALAGTSLGIVFIVFVWQVFNFSLPANMRSIATTNLLRSMLPASNDKV